MKRFIGPQRLHRARGDKTDHQHRGYLRRIQNTGHKSTRKRTHKSVGGQLGQQRLQRLPRNLLQTL